MWDDQVHTIAMYAEIRRLRLPQGLMNSETARRYGPTVFRGVAPQDALSVRAVAGLKADGLTVPDGKPAALDPADLG